MLRAGVARELSECRATSVVVHEAWEDSSRLVAESIATAAEVEASSLGSTIELAAALRGDVYLLLDQLEAYFVHHGADVALADGIADSWRARSCPCTRCSRSERTRWRDSRVQGPATGPARRTGSGSTTSRGPTAARDRRANRAIGKLVNEADGLAATPISSKRVDGVRARARIQRDRGRGVSKEASQGRIETPYLQLVMQRLWEAERAEGRACCASERSSG